MKTIKVLAVLPVLLLAAACGGTGAMSAESGAGGSAAGQARVPAASGDLTSSAERFGSAAGPGHGRPAAMQRAVISHGNLEMVTGNVSRARDDVLRLLRRWDGQVADEEAGSDQRGRMVSVSLRLRIPSADFDTAMSELAKVARTTHQQVSSEDVTTQVIDVNARVRAKQDAIDRIEQLLAHAKNLGQIIAIETDLGNRQAELDSLKQQQAWLADQTSLSTIEVTISRHVPPPAHRHHDSGFLAGLSSGWHALGTAAVAVLTVVGAVLPFALVLGVVAVPLWLGWRRWGRKPVPAPPVAPPPGA
ncbi:MAG TPA: DUF4349 domain-containing protein [Marmoricola sp.]|nr:DUF4349 domain-containing protein [Marmoricola sp.]